MATKVLINCLDDFSLLTGQELFTSEPILVTKEKIQHFCASVNQMDWFHWDEEASKESSFGNIVAPGMYTMSLLHSVYFDNVEINNITALFLGSDRFRILKPVTAGSKLTLKFIIERIEKRELGIAIHYDFTWTIVGENQPVTLGNFIVRYW